MPKERDTKDVAELLEFALSFGTAIGNATQDGKFDLSDIGFFIPSLTVLPRAVEGIMNVPGELADLSEDEVAMLRKQIGDFDIPQDEVEEVIERALKFAMETISFVSYIGRKID